MQSISLPEEDPAIFHFIVAFLYEDKYVPIKPIASALGMVMCLRLSCAVNGRLTRHYSTR